LRGEDLLSASYASDGSGSPPLARRGPRPLGARDFVLRLTSARAKRAASPGRPLPRRLAHLHSRGEDRRVAFGFGEEDGSPPLARRGPEDQAGTPAERRFTSACAERTADSGYLSTDSAAHLRSRGEDV
jgi:hypothetical protein